MKNPLVFENVSYRYGAREIFGGLTITFAPHLRHALIGPNAAGKTTLLRLASGLLKPSSGRVTVDGQEISTLDPIERARRLAVVPQFETNVFPISVRELAATGRYCRQSGYFAGESDGAVDHALARAGALHLADRSVWDLSGGERQRALIARALAQDADWMLLDEATTFLDLRAEYELFQLLETLQREGLSILAVTHDLQAAARADVVTLLAGGHASQGKPEEILTPERLSAAYGMPFYVERLDGRVFIGPAS